MIPSGVSQMCISNTGSCSSWEAYAASKPWTLSGGDGNKTVYVWFKDNPGNIDGTPYSDSILLDTTAPSNGSLTATPGHQKVSLTGMGSLMLRVVLRTINSFLAPLEHPHLVPMEQRFIREPIPHTCTHPSPMGHPIIIGFVPRIMPAIHPAA